MAALATVAPKMAKLIPMLGTDQDGEIIATVRAIRRTLDGAGLDLHDLARALSGVSPRPEWTSPHSSEPSPRKPTRFSFSGVSSKKARAEIAGLLAEAELTDWEADFLTSIAEGLRVRPDRLLTPKQVRVLNGVWRRHHGET